MKTNTENTNAPPPKKKGWDCLRPFVLPLLVGGPLIASIGIGFGIGVESGILAAGLFLMGLSAGITITETCLQHD